MLDNLMEDGYSAFAKEQLSRNHTTRDLKDPWDPIHAWEDDIWYPPAPDDTECSLEPDDDEKKRRDDPTTTTPHTETRTTPGSKTQRSETPPPTALDPIENAAGVKWCATKYTSAGYIIPPTIKNALDSLDANLWSLSPEAKQTLKDTRVKSYLSKTMIKDLHKYGCIEQINPDDALGWIHAFPVQKSNNAQRFIGHPKILNESLSWATGEASIGSKVKLGSLTALLLAIKQIPFLTDEERRDQQRRGLGNLYCSESDYKNFFPQVYLPPHTRKYFCIHNVDEDGTHTFWRMCCLVQGWSASTSTAQALSWWAIAKDWPALLSALSKLDHLPGFVTVQEGTRKAVIAIVYDNIGVFTNDASYRKQILSRLNKSCHTTDLNIKFKYIEKSINTFTFLGLEGAWGQSEPRPHPLPTASPDFPQTTHSYPQTPRNLFWRILPDSFHKWNVRARDLLSTTFRDGNGTPREMMQMYGYISRYIHISNGERYTKRHLTSAVASVSRHLKTKHDWKTPTHLSSEATILLTHAVLALKNDWHSHTCSTASRPYAVVTDASLGKLGYVAFTKEGPTNQWCVRHQNTLRRHHTSSIEEEEARAVAWALKELESDLIEYKPDTIICGIDNLGVSRSLLRGVSAGLKTNPHIQLAIESLLCLTHPKKIALLDIHTDDNVADVLTRHEDTASQDYHTRRLLTMKALDRAVTNIDNDIRWTSRIIPETIQFS